MRHLIFAFAILTSFVAPAVAQSSCTIILAAESGDALHETGEACDERFAPASTFKVALSLMGFDSGLLIDADNPALPYKDEYDAPFEAWKVTTTPRRWLSESVVWYSQVLVPQLGEQRFASYVADFGYGNADVSRDPGANNGMTHSWLGSSLTISPREQAQFLSRILVGDVPVSAAAVETTKAIMPQFDSGDWSVWGKTGTALERKADGQPDFDRQLGWFVGWATKGDRTVVFVRFLRDGGPVDGRAGQRARDSVLAELPALAGS